MLSLVVFFKGQVQKNIGRCRGSVRCTVRVYIAKATFQHQSLVYIFLLCCYFFIYICVMEYVFIFFFTPVF